MARLHRIPAPDPVSGRPALGRQFVIRDFDPGSFQPEFLALRHPDVRRDDVRAVGRACGDPSRGRCHPRHAGFDRDMHDLNSPIGRDLGTRLSVRKPQAVPGHNRRYEQPPPS